MSAKNDILSLLRKQEALASTAARKAIIIQPGAIGDCILTLPLAQYMKKNLKLGSIVFLSHLDYAGIFAGRTCVDGVKSIESARLHRLFVDKKEFDLDETDPLLTTFAPYSWILTFMGEPDSDFEQNLIYTAHCTHSAEIISLAFKPAIQEPVHISRFYIEQFAKAIEPPLTAPPHDIESRIIAVTDNDKAEGAELLHSFDIDAASDNTIVIAPGSGSMNKCWPIENFLTVAQELISADRKILFLLGPSELEMFKPELIRHLAEIAPCVSNMPLLSVLQILAASKGFIGNDSGIAHLAAAIGTKTIAVFGPTFSDIYRPLGPDVHIFQIPTDEFSSISAFRSRQVVEAMLKCN